VPANNQSPLAISALEKAFSINKRSSYIAVRLANTYVHKGNKEAAVKVLRECIDANPSDKYANYKLAMLLADMKESNPADIKYCLRNAFTTGDNNYIAQFWYARFVYLEGNFSEAREIFNKLSQLNIDARTINKPRGTVINGNKPKVFSGSISKLENSWGFILRDQQHDRIFAFGKYSDNLEWQKLSINKRINFELAFCYRGPTALHIRSEAK